MLENLKRDRKQIFGKNQAKPGRTGKSAMDVVLPEGRQERAKPVNKGEARGSTQLFWWVCAEEQGLGSGFLCVCEK